MPKNDCPVCQQEGPHYVPQGCIRSLLAKVVALSERVGALEHWTPSEETGSIADRLGRIADAEVCQRSHALLDADVPVLLQQTASAVIGQKPTQSERMKQYWRNKKAKG